MSTFTGKTEKTPMSEPGWQPAQYDPYARQQRMVQPQQQYPQQYSAPPQQYAPRPVQQVPQSGMTAAAKFWYILMCIPLGAGYLAKVPAKKALADAGLATMTGAESFWYIAMCIFPPFAAYFAKIPTAKAISELPQFHR
jgi:hypothetical protein